MSEHWDGMVSEEKYDQLLDKLEAAEMENRRLMLAQTEVLRLVGIKMDEAEQTIVCLKTDIPMADRLLNQRESIGKLQATIKKISELPSYSVTFLDKETNLRITRLVVNADELQAIIGSES